MQNDNCANVQNDHLQIANFKKYCTKNMCKFADNLQTQHVANAANMTTCKFAVVNRYCETIMEPTAAFAAFFAACEESATFCSICFMVAA